MAVSLSNELPVLSDDEAEEMEYMVDEIRKDMSPEEVAEWLKKKEIPVTYCTIFESMYKY